MSFEIIHPLVEAYVGRYTSATDPILQQIERETLATHVQPWMLSGPLQGKLLEILSCMMRPSRILEIGTMTGYSSVCLVKGLAAGGVLHTIEKREADAAAALENFKEAGVQDQIHLHVGDAREILPRLNESWDLVFLDADKTGYTDYYRLVKPRLRAGGLIIADNVLYHGEVLSEEIKSKNAKAIQQFNQYVCEDKDVETLLLPIRDGLMLILKKQIL
jgi:predicted O-methyltransferase YrrM